MSDQILNIAVERVATAVAFTGNTTKQVTTAPQLFPSSISRGFRIVVTSDTVVGTITPSIMESDTNADFSNVTPVNLLQVYGRGGLTEEEAVDSATITAAKFAAGVGKKEYFIACNPTKKYFGLRLTGTDSSEAVVDVDLIYMPEFLPIK